MSCYSRYYRLCASKGMVFFRFCASKGKDLTVPSRLVAGVYLFWVSTRPLVHFPPLNIEKLSLWNANRKPLGQKLATRRHVTWLGAALPFDLECRCASKCSKQVPVSIKIEGWWPKMLGFLCVNMLFIGLKDTILPDSRHHAAQRSIFYIPFKFTMGITLGGDFLSVIMWPFQEVQSRSFLY